MSDPHLYPHPAISVTWSRRRCTHAAECVMLLPSVFEPGRRPWVIPGEAPADAIARVIARCPTGALQFTRHDGAQGESPDAENVVRVMRHGPLQVRGDLLVANPEGGRRETRVTLCRCGLTRNPPFCDDAHAAARFREAGEVFEGKVTPAENAAGPLRITARPNGPLKLVGPFTIVSGDGRVRVSGSETALCRCGQSRKKPFCDKSHEAAEFLAAALAISDDAPRAAEDDAARGAHVASDPTALGPPAGAPGGGAAPEGG
jgi:CDGSH-type Zn-finger protein/uncharacterized Fe-S cluster protein YjdI